MGMPFSKPLRDGIFELRTQYHDGISRVCYFFVYNKKIILTHGFIKKTEKTPNSEINKAIKYMNDYLARNGQMKNPEFKKEWDQLEPEYKIVQYLVENDIPFTQEFLDILDALTEKGMIIQLISSETNISETDKVKTHLPEYA